MKLRQHPFLTGVGIGVLAIAALAFVWNWNWFIPLLTRVISRQLDRPVTIARFDVHDIITGSPLLVLDGITIANPPDFPDDGGRMGTIGRLSVRVAAGPLLRSMGHDIVLREVTIEHPEGDLRTSSNGERNWAFNLSGGGSSGSSRSVRVGALIVTDGNFHINDPKLKVNLALKVRTEQPKGDGEPRLVASAQGTYAGRPFKGNFTGGSILSLRDPKKPYPVDLVATNGATRIAVKGTVTDAAQLAGANLQMELAGPDLARLYPVLGIPLAETPPYTIRGHIDYSRTHIKLSDFAGTVGQSDLTGDFDVDRGRDRPLITAELRSRKVLLSDLGGFLGTSPDKPGTPKQAPEHRAQLAQREASPTLLPDEPFNFAKLRSADFRVHFKGDHIEANSVPLDNIEANLNLDNGKLVLQPLNFGIGHGGIASSLLLDAQQNPIAAKASIDFRQIDFQRLIQATKRFEGIGVIGGRAEIDARGNSPAAMLANGNGGVKLFMGGGNVSALLVNLAGLDFGKSLLSALGLPDKTAVRCMVSDFALEQGVLQTRALVFDTNEANILGRGHVDFRNNTVDYQIEQQPKHFSILALHAPIKITGALKSPTIIPDPGRLGMKAGLAVITGLLATVQLGLGENNNCDALIQSAQQAAEAPPQLAPEQPHKAEGSSPSTRPRGRKSQHR